MTKQLMFLISTEGKTAKQVAKEGRKAFQKFKRVEANVLARMEAEELVKIEKRK